MSELTSNQAKSNSTLAYVWGKYREYAFTSRKRKMKRNKNMGLSLGVFAVVLGALGITGWTAGWIAVISTIAASITAFAYAGRYQYLIISYQTTANKLERLRVLWESKGKTDNDTDTRNKFIRECEAMISIENSAWMVEIEMAK
jgi:hypothetical protein